MSNSVAPTTPLIINGTTYNLFWDFETIALAEELTDRTLYTSVWAQNLRTPRISFVRALLFACLLPKHPKMTVADAKALVNKTNVIDVWNKIIEAWTADLRGSEPDAEASEDPTPAQS